MKISFSLFCLLLVFTFGAGRADAHKVTVFAYEDRGEIITEARFNSGRPAKESAVTVEHSGTLLLSGVTDDNGIFRFTPPESAKKQHLDLNIVVDLGEGHRGSWLLRASDYLDVPATGDTTVSVTEKSTKDPVLSQQPTTPQGCKDLEEVIANRLEAELAPIKRLLAESTERKTSLQDILGGLGYIFGLAGIGAYFRYRQKGEKA